MATGYSGAEQTTMAYYGAIAEFSRATSRQPYSGHGMPRPFNETRASDAYDQLRKISLRVIELGIESREVALRRLLGFATLAVEQATGTFPVGKPPVYPDIDLHAATHFAGHVADLEAIIAYEEQTDDREFPDNVLDLDAFRTRE